MKILISLGFAFFHQALMICEHFLCLVRLVHHITCHKISKIAIYRLQVIDKSLVLPNVQLILPGYLYLIFLYQIKYIQNLEVI